MASMEFQTPKGPSTRIQHRRMESPFKIPPSPLMTKLGFGTGVVIYRFQRSPQPSSVTAKSPWAVKKVKRDFNGTYSSKIHSCLNREAIILRQLDHPNIVKFKGTGVSQDGEFCLSMEDCGQSLLSIIEDRKDAEEDRLQSTEVMKIATDIANALNYLHNKKKLLHGDIKSDNVLVKGDFTEVKLCDFGVSIFLKEDLSGPVDPGVFYVGTEPWRSPEVLDSSDGPITDKADIFAYGLVIWETLTLQIPHVDLMFADKSSDSSSLNGSFLEESCNDITCPDYYEALGTRPPLPEEEYGAEYDTAIGLFVCCTHSDYQKRPSASKIHQILSEEDSND